jgi:hypothetical protein
VILPARVAVGRFEDRSGYKGKWDLEEGLRELLAEALARSGRFEVVPDGRSGGLFDTLRRHGERLLSGAHPPPAGRGREPRALIEGIITEFSLADPAAAEPPAGRSRRRRRPKARLALTLHVVDAADGRLIETVPCGAEASAGAADPSHWDDVVFGSGPFSRTSPGAAVAGTLRIAVHELKRIVPPTRWLPMIASVAGGRIILNGGADRGFRPGQVFEVRDRGEAVTDPVTGALLTTVPGHVIGRVRVAAVEERVAYAEPVQGGDFRRGHALVQPGHGPPR